AHSYPRHQARPAPAEDRQSHRTRGDRGENRLHAAPHHTLRSWRHLCRCARDQDGKAPGGIFMIDHESFEPLGRWEVDRGPQRLSYDGWWHLGYDTLVTSEWGTPDTFENGLVPEILLGAKYGRRLHFWDFTKRKHLQEIDFGPEYQLVFEL